MQPKQRKKVAFVNLPDSRLDVFSRVTSHPEYRPEVVIHVNPSATVIKMADLLQVPASPQLALLRRFPCQFIVVPDDRPDLKVEVADHAGNPPALILTVSEMAARLGSDDGDSRDGQAPTGSGWLIPRQERLPIGAAPPAGPPRDAAHHPGTSRVIDPSALALDRPSAIFEESGSTLNLRGDKHQLLERILQIAVTSVQGDAGSIMLLDESGEYLRIAVAVGLSGDVVRRTRQRIGEGVAGSVMLEGRGRILRDTLRDPRYRDGRERSAIKCAVSVPILMGEQPVGVLNVSSDESRDALTERSQARLEKFGIEMASVILKAMEQPVPNDLALEATLKKQVDHRMVLLEPLEQRLQALARIFGEQFGEAVCRIYVLDGTGRRLVPLAVHDPEALAPAAPRSAQSGLSGRVFRSQRSEAFLPRLPGPVSRGLVLVPFSGEEPIGLIELEDVPEELAAGSEQIESLARVAYHLGQYIEAERATRVMARRSRQIMHMGDLAVEMLGDVTLEILIDMALASAAGLFDADLAGLRLYPEDEVTFSDPDFAGRDPLDMESFLAFDRALAEAARRHDGILSAETLPPDLADRLTSQNSIRWVAAVVLRGPTSPLGVLTLYGLSEGSVGLAEEEHDVLERFCGYLIQGLTRAICDPPDIELPERFLPWEGFKERVGAQTCEQGAAVLIVISTEPLGLQALEKGRAWVDGVRNALQTFISRNLDPDDVATRIREGRYAILPAHRAEPTDGFSRALLDTWAEDAAQSGIENLSRLPLCVETFAFPRDSRNLEEFLDLAADRFGIESEEGAA